MTVRFKFPERDKWDITTLVRKTLPLPEVHLDTGPSTENQLRCHRSYAEMLLQSTSQWSRPIDAIVLVTWAVDGIPPHGDRLDVIT